MDLIIHSAGILSSYRGMCFEKFITDLEVVRMIEHHLAGIAVDDNALALSVIIETGHGGQFLTHSHTLEKCRSVPWTSVLADAGHKKSEETAQEAYLAKVNRSLARILSAYRQPELDPDLRIALENFLMQIGVDAMQLQILGEAAARP